MDDSLAIHLGKRILSISARCLLVKPSCVCVWGAALVLGKGGKWGHSPPPSLQLLLPWCQAEQAAKGEASPSSLKCLLIFFPRWRKNLKWVRPPKQRADGMRNPALFLLKHLTGKRLYFFELVFFLTRRLLMEKDFHLVVSCGNKTLLLGSFYSKPKCF